MPLPVEKSAGKVSSLVQRWQTAADIEQQQAARRESGSRRSSINSLGRMSSDTFSAKPSPKVEGGEALPKVENEHEDEGVEEMLNDFEEKMTVSVSESGNKQDIISAPVESESGAEAAGSVADGKQEKEDMEASTRDEGKNQEKAPVSEPDSAVAAQSTGTTQTQLIESTDKGTAAKLQATVKKASAPPSVGTQKPLSSNTASRIPSSITKPASNARKPSDSTTRPAGSASIAKPNDSAKPPAAKSSTARPASAFVPAKTAASSNAGKAASLSSTVRKPVATAKPAAPGPSSRPRQAAPTSATRTATSSTAQKPRASSISRPPPSSFTNPASRAKPSTNQNGSTTRPVRRPSSAVPPTTSKPPTTAPLRPQMTGTPAKPTASSLAKAREAAEKRQSSSLGRASGTTAKQRLSLAPQAMGHNKSASAPSASATVTTGRTPSSSGSRLLQGTASSRAKAAEPLSPRSPRTSTAPREGLTARVNLAAEKSTPTRPAAPFTSQTPKSPSAQRTPATRRSPVTSKTKEGRSSILAPPSSSSAKAATTPKSLSVEKVNGGLSGSPPPSPITAMKAATPGTAGVKREEVSVRSPHGTPKSARKSALPRTPVSAKSSGTSKSPVTPKSPASARTAEASLATPIKQSAQVAAAADLSEAPLLPTSADHAEGPTAAASSGKRDTVDDERSVKTATPTDATDARINGTEQSKNEEVTHTPLPIGRIGLAAAREAPKQDEESEPTSLTPAPAETEQSIEQHEDEPLLITKETEQVSPMKDASNAPTAETHTVDRVDSLEEVKQAGEVEEPETARSAPQDPSGLFGRIGHPGANVSASGRQMESPNPQTTASPAQSEDRVEIKWNEDELKRDPAKTILSPDASKTPKQSN